VFLRHDPRSGRERREEHPRRRAGGEVKLRRTTILVAGQTVASCAGCP
jgi:hypothetical protein